MKTNELKSIIRTIIQEELKTALPTMIPKILTEILSNSNRIVETSSNNVQSTSAATSSTPATKTYKKYTSNEMLNQILNETVGGVPKEGSFIGYSSPIKPVGAASFESEPQQLNESVLPMNEKQKNVLNVINKDFRSLMKAVDKKKKSGDLSSNLVQSQ
jgi:hypothetical protein